MKIPALISELPKILGGDKLQYKSMIDETPIPIAAWEEPKPFYANLVWCARIDNRYQIEVQRQEDGPARLIIFDHDHDMSPIHSEQTPLSYGARFGPDVEDVLRWQQTVEKIIDQL